MSISIPQLCSNLDLSCDKVRKLTQNFCESLDITVFGYVRIYNNGTVSWLTTDPEQDCFLIESESLNQDPNLDTKPALHEGCYLDLNNREFEGSDIFYKERAKKFSIDHTMVVVRHQKNFVETCCFSGLTSKRSLIQLFMNKQPLFHAYMSHFTSQLDGHLLDYLKQTISLSEFKDSYGVSTTPFIDEPILGACGWSNLAHLSSREKQCLMLLKTGLTHAAIGLELSLSPRTVEHYLESVKNKLGITSRSELFLAAEKLSSCK